MKTVIIINEDHNLLPIQQQELLDICEEWDTFSIPRGGLSAEAQIEAASDLWNTYGQIVFVSPVPICLAQTALLLGIEFTCGDENHQVFIFSNDKREKKVLPDGRVISMLSHDGWRLLRLC